MSNDLFTKYAGVEIFRLQDIACLWAGVEEFKDNKILVQSHYDTLEKDARKGSLLADRGRVAATVNILTGERTYKPGSWLTATVARTDLISYFEQKDTKPAFLFPAAPPTKATDEASPPPPVMVEGADTRIDDTSTLVEMVGERRQRLFKELGSIAAVAKHENVSRAAVRKSINRLSKPKLESSPPSETRSALKGIFG